MTDKNVRFHGKEIIDFFDYIGGSYSNVDAFAEDVSKAVEAVRARITSGTERLRSKGYFPLKVFIDTDRSYQDDSTISISFYREETADEQEKREREELRATEQRLREREKQDAQDRALYERLKKKYG